ncbi:T9SS type A sorting domain-containing protein [Changchengzhania lutea]|uniref:T9SS type A sorting domain-containing protein n=1 Tax=Changchengzhania lutea TaxID=2049305 RepID=UPI00115E381F|nr:T9SS type A sorting domain-containing protein [Changchengzhania lutea]
MKTKLLTLFFLGIISVNAQITHNLDWRIGIGTSIDLTIDTGDTVIWTWTDSAPHTVTNKSGSAEVFDSGTITGNEMTYSKTFTVVGTNPYQCDIHPGSMAGTITVENALGIDDFLLNSFSISPNPARSYIKLDSPSQLIIDNVKVFDVLGKEIYSKNKLEEQINISNFSKGIYILKVSSLGKIKTIRLIKI